MNFQFYVAKKFLFSNKFQLVLITLGIAIGVSVQIFIGLLIQGLQDGLVEKTIGNQSHIDIVIENNADYDNVYQELELVNEVSVIAPTITLNSIITSSDNASIILKGIDSSQNSNTYDIQNKIIEGTLPSGNKEIIIGKELAENNNIQVGDTIELLIENEDTSFIISGIYDLNIKTINEVLVIIDIDNLREVLTEYDQLIELQLLDPFIADTLELNLSEEVEVSNWKDNNEELLSGLNGQSISSLMIQIFVMVSVILGISSVLIITAIQKAKQIGIFKAFGLNNNNAGIIFLLYGLMIGLIGATLGVIIGVSLIESFTYFTSTDGEALIAINYNYTFIFGSWLLAVIAAMVSSVIPAVKTAKLSPMEVIRGD